MSLEVVGVSFNYNMSLEVVGVGFNCNMSLEVVGVGIVWIIFPTDLLNPTDFFNRNKT